MYKLNTKLYPIAIDKSNLGEKQLNEIIYSIVQEGQKALNLKDKTSIENCNLIENLISEENQLYDFFNMYYFFSIFN